MTARVKGLQQAIAAEAWELVALAIVIGALETLRQLPPNALPALLDLAGGDDALHT